MNSNPNGNLRRPTNSPSKAPHPARSAAPSPVDIRGVRQRTRQYANEQNAEINRIRQENPNLVKHKTYNNSYASKRKRNARIVLVLVLFLALSLSLLLVWGIAELAKDYLYPDIEAATTTDEQNGITPSDSDSPSTDEGGDTSDTSDTSEDTTADTQDEPVTVPVYALPTNATVELDSELLSTNAILIDLNAHSILAQKGGNDRIFPASMTKVLTLLVAVENMPSLDTLATVTPETVDYCYREGASIAYFKANEVVTIEDLLYGTILPSGADATMTLAECIAGSEEAFVELMNQKVAELGLTGTHFVNTSGLHDPDHYSTPHDIALIVKAAMENNICFKVLTAETYTTSVTPQSPEGIKLTSIVHNRLAYTVVNGLEIVGGKTGYTPEAGNCMVTYAASNDGKHEYILVTANADPSKKLDPVKDAEYVYKTYTHENSQSGDVAA